MKRNNLIFASSTANKTNVDDDDDALYFQCFVCNCNEERKLESADWLSLRMRTNIP